MSGNIEISEIHGDRSDERIELYQHQRDFDTREVDVTAKTPTCYQVYKKIWDDDSKRPISVLMLVFTTLLPVVLFGLFWYLFYTNIQSSETTYTCSLDPTRSYPVIMDAGYIVASVNETDPVKCQSCGHLYACLYMQSRNMTGDCCSDPCVDPDSGQHVSSLKSVVHVYDWTMLMACYIQELGKTYYLRQACPFEDRVCQQSLFTYLSSFPRVTVCDLDQTSDSYSLDCFKGSSWNKLNFLILIPVIVLFGMHVWLYQGTKKNMMK